MGPILRIQVTSVSFHFSGFKLALITASDYYRDYYFYKWMNGKWVQQMNELPIEPPRSLEFFINESKTAESTSSETTENPISEDTPQSSSHPPAVSKYKVTSYRVQHPCQDKDLAEWVEDHRILTKS